MMISRLEHQHVCVIRSVFDRACLVDQVWKLISAIEF